MTQAPEAEKKTTRQRASLGSTDGEATSQCGVTESTWAETSNTETSADVGAPAAGHTDSTCNSPSSNGRAATPILVGNETQGNKNIGQKQCVDSASSNEDGQQQLTFTAMEQRQPEAVPPTQNGCPAYPPQQHPGDPQSAAQHIPSTHFTIVPPLVYRMSDGTLKVPR
ncbi:hypothetical protein BDN67DRAFT_984742 [Paxillus ammoniavirescens]|nr:hypothetical protein BDN67DRAFT_984742 [Paxillus ammoniavirescens]